MELHSHFPFCEECTLRIHPCEDHKGSSSNPHPLSFDQVSDDMASVIVAQLLFLEAENPEKPISLYINSPGGSVTAGMAIYDTVKKKSQPGGLWVGVKKKPYVINMPSLSWWWMFVPFYRCR